MTMKNHLMIRLALTVLLLGLLVVLLVHPIRAQAALFLRLPAAAHTDHAVLYAPVATTTPAIPKHK